MKLHCAKCGRSISIEVPDDTVLRAYAVYPDGYTDEGIDEE